jgi:hypothetical protein
MSFLHEPPPVRVCGGQFAGRCWTNILIFSFAVLPQRGGSKKSSIALTAARRFSNFIAE